MTGRSLRLLRPLAPALATVLLARSDAARELLPALGLFAGPLGLVLLALGLTAGIAQAVAWRPPSPSPALLFASSFVLAAALGVHHVSRLPPTGDEIRYLLVAQSLWRDGDIDLRDNFERGDFREYVPELRRRLGIRGRKGPLVPLHRPGLPALVAPAYAVAGRAGCAVLLAALLAALGLVVRRLALRATGDERGALVAWAASVGPPALFFGAFLYPEVPAALAVGLALLAIEPAAGALRATGAALAVSALPWLHPRLGMGAGALGLLGLAVLKGRARAAFVVTAASMAAAYLAFNESTYGAWLPTRAYRGTVGRARPEEVAAGLLLDPSFGLLTYAPVFLLAAAAAPALLRRGGSWRLGVPLVLAALLLPVLTFGHWYGGFSPPARLVTSCVPLLAVLLSLRLAEPGAAGRGLARWAVPLLGLGFALAGFAFARPEDRLHVQGRHSEPRLWAALAGEVPLTRYLPRMARPADPAAAMPEAPADEKRVAFVWSATLVALLALDRAAARSDRVDRAFRGLTLPLGLFVLLSLAVDGWARRDGTTPPTPPGVEDEDGAEEAG